MLSIHQVLLFFSNGNFFLNCFFVVNVIIEEFGKRFRNVSHVKLASGLANFQIPQVTHQNSVASNVEHSNEHGSDNERKNEDNDDGQHNSRLRISS